MPNAPRPPLTLIAAVARNGAIGRDNQLLFRIPGDLPRLKRLTLGHPVIMGRKTWDSLPPKNRPLPGRLNIVVTRNRDWQAEGAVVAHGLEDALAHTRGAQQAFVIGGAELYALALPHADRLDLTEVDQEAEGDAFFPVWARSDYEEIERESHRASESAPFDYAFVTYQRKR
ncbi:dihydrofolate reductase [Piscinibacter sp. HJYY11]|uniref:dihydrofolate reductase n=1 Tax=Piscinibacter sp. HJYY11 TaxID=2801333 RepID=UPI00191FE9DE|nr:dihydrofolate reductase [Piscinibacter sp. HJYY11]MBL0730885.1 dihydrofolate reductase [Piscinibacter sp. HJYY11]